MEKLFIGEIPVLVHVKKDNKPKALLILSHGFSGSKENWIDRMHELAGLDYICVALDNRCHGERKGVSFKDKIFSADGKLKMSILRKIKRETADDVSAIIDYMLNNYNVIHNKIGMIGISMGGYITYAALVREKRITAAIPFISSPNWEDLPEDTPIDEKDLDRFTDFINSFNPASEYKKIYPCSLFISAGKYDKHFNLEKLIRFHKCLKSLYEKNPSMLQIKLYETAHEVTGRMWDDAVKWLRIIL